MFHGSIMNLRIKLFSACHAKIIRMFCIIMNFYTWGVWIPCVALNIAGVECMLFLCLCLMMLKKYACWFLCSTKFSCLQEGLAKAILLDVFLANVPVQYIFPRFKHVCWFVFSKNFQPHVLCRYSEVIFVLDAYMLL